MILTETVAVRLFGDVEKAVGQSVKSTGLTQYDPPYTVTAVIKDPPGNTNLSFEAILSHEQIKMHKTFVDESGKRYGILPLYRCMRSCLLIRMSVALPVNCVIILRGHWRTRMSKYGCCR